MLHLNDYVLDKAFVSCVICLSKWLKKDDFPQGITEWPPQMPADLPRASAPIADDSLTMGIRQSLGELGDRDDSPRRRKGFPAMSSDGAL